MNETKTTTTTNVLVGTVGTLLVNEVEDEKLMETWAYHLSAVILFFIGLFGFSLNLIVIILMCKDIQLWTPMNIILFNLVSSDLLVSILGNPFTLTAAISHKWIFGTSLCIAYGFFMALLGITSIITLTVLAYERYCLVAYPLSTHQITQRGAFGCIGFIWTYSFTLTTPPLFGWGAYVNEAANISCSVNWETKSFNATSYIVYLFVFGLVIPVIIISYSYINIILAMRRNSLRLGRKNRAEKRVTIMIAVMILAFLIAWTPYAVFALVEQFGPGDLISPKMAVLPSLIAKSSICYNPLIYVGLNTQFRASWKRNITKESTVIETTVNQISQSSTPSHKCTPNIVRQGKAKLLKARLTGFARIRSNGKLDLNNDGSINGRGGTKRLESNDNSYTTRICDIGNVRGRGDDDEKCKMKIEHSSIVNQHEMVVFSERKTALIKSNSYHSNIC